MPIYRGRFAPSPTGPLHFGSLVAAMASYADARHHGGEWLVRIEDVDESRARDDEAKSILRTLDDLGFRWNHEVSWQSRRAEVYGRALEALVRSGNAYPCICPRRSLETAGVGPTGERIYPGTCRTRTVVPDGPHAWRVRVDHQPVQFVDRLQGSHVQDLEGEVGDFIVRRADGYFAYQLAVVVDDAAQGVTDVVRGADLLASTPRQIHLQHCLGHAIPRYLHVPVALDPAGRKLSKQTGARALPAAPSVETLLCAWGFLGQASPQAVPATIAEFWSYAGRAWDPALLPPVPMLPAPAHTRGAV